MAEDRDDAQRTEEPTAKRLSDARKKGDAPKSQEVTVTILLAAAALCLWLFAGPAAHKTASALKGFVDHPHMIEVSGPALLAIFTNTAQTVGAALAMLGVVLMFGALAGNMVQARPVFTTERMKPSLSKLSPLKGLGRIFGPSGLVNFAKGLGKLVIMGALIGGFLWAERFRVVGLVGQDGAGVLQLSASLVLQLLVSVVAVMAVLAGLDFMWQSHAWKKRLRMTREEVKREMKETDGDPQVRARQRQTRDARARQRTIAAVKEASVVIMNPTHFAVALAYEDGVNAAPICTAKGMDELALRMRQVARDHNVPVVENPPLARALHANAEIDREIPVAHYEAVAKIIGFILSRGGKSGARAGSRPK